MSNGNINIGFEDYKDKIIFSLLKSLNLAIDVIESYEKLELKELCKDDYCLEKARINSSKFKTYLLENCNPKIFEKLMRHKCQTET
ncbi:MAG: hypothetical protein ACFFE4_00535 [Candidatus Thorarchaeota archaeon]